MAQVDLLSRVAGRPPSGRRSRARHLARRFALAALVAAGCLPWTGCLFVPREAEPPETGTIVRYQEQISPAAAWDNLETSAEATHAPGWENAISPDFRYIPDSAAESQFPGVFTDWNRDKELAFINRFYNSGVTISARMRNLEFVVPPSSGSESVWENVIYDMTVTGAGGGSSVRYRGSAIITFALEGNFWYIKEWRDQQGESDPDTQQLLSTLGVLRGNFASK